MNTIFKSAILLASFQAVFYSCNEPAAQEPDTETTKTGSYSSAFRKKAELDKLYDSKSALKREFAYALAVSVSESEALRALIKARALEKFDDEYEVLYSTIRDEKISNGLTVEKLISKFISNKKILSELERTSPTLTISVPDLPNHLFNATIWNTSTEVPSIAVRLENSNDVPIISSDGSENIMEAQYVPGFPVIVLKESERILAESDQSFDKNKTKEFKDKRGHKYKFTSENFDSKSNRNKRIINASEVDPKLIAAYNSYVNVNGWQRDQIYYNITPSQVRGEFDNKFEETITSFSLMGNPWAAYYKIADQSDDPHSENYRGNSSQPHWTDGAFEFKITALINAKSGIGPTIESYFSVSPSEIFYLHYRQASHNWFGKDKYELDNITFANNQVNLNLPIIKWNLQNYAVAIKLSFEEVDLSTTTTITNVHATKFAANFEVNAAVTKKVGLKLGASMAVDNTQTHVTVVNLTNDKLGDVIVDFGDNIINSVSGSSAELKDYYVGSYAKFNIIPKKVY